MQKPQRIQLYFFLILALAVLIRFPYIPTLPFDSDQAVVGLMAKHILEGALPWLFYGDSYGGILEPILSALCFLLLGVSRFSLQLVLFLFSILFILSIYQLACRLYNQEVGLISMLLAALPPYSTTLETLMANGGYIEVLWLGNLILLFSYRLAGHTIPVSFCSLGFFGLGLFWGIAWWTHPISLIYLVTSFSFLALQERTFLLKGKVLITSAGFFLGSLPFWIWNVGAGFPFFTMALSPGTESYWKNFGVLWDQILQMFGLNPGDPVTLMAYGATFIFLAGLSFMLNKNWLKDKFPFSHGSFLLLLCFLLFIIIYVRSGFSERDALRYLLPLYSLFPICLALFFYVLKSYWRPVSLILLVSLLLFNGYQTILEFPLWGKKAEKSLKDVQVETALINFLKKNKMSSAYDPEYWSSAGLTFASLEKKIFSLPFNDRYPLYTLQVDASSNPAFVLEGSYRNSFEEMFRTAGGTYKKEIISLYEKTKGYVVYYDFKAPGTLCQEILPDLWTGKSNFNPGSEKMAFDRNISTHWTSSVTQKPEMYFQIDLGKIYKISRLVQLCAKGKEWHSPAHYQLELSKNGQDWTTVSAVKNNWAYLFWSGGRPFWKLRDGRLENTFNSQEAQFIKITLTEPSPRPWTIGELFVYQAAEPVEAKTISLEELITFFSREKIQYVYADIGLSAQITLATQGRIKCLQEDYDITHGEDYSRRGYNGAFPYFNKLKKQVDFSLSPAFVVAEENKTSFVRTMNRLKVNYSVKVSGDQLIFYGIKGPAPAKAIRGAEDSGYFYWNGTHLLQTE